MQFYRLQRSQFVFRYNLERAASAPDPICILATVTMFGVGKNKKEIIKKKEIEDAI